MSENPEVIRANIEQTRQNLSYNVDAVADKVSPSHVAHRQTEKIKDAVFGAKDKIMGAADDTSGRAGDAVSGAGEAVGEVPHRVARQTRGNPLAAGLVAFGVGMLVSSLIPPSEKEQELAQTVKEKAEPLTEQVKGAASEVASNLKEPAQQAAQSVQATATDAASNVKDEAQTQTSSVQDRAQEATQNVRES
ncbi:DUF3618 domain-containing protein [Paenarthrobacter sp. DKR-5]|uniref:DUF3618 domain-containing protein n=1 Tax=Paenarthrobacter sp. DKR-5 TaxID=2835535 RepID=UPI001BDD5D10|nr:DUF3618 domain-containing protein [Paenarthrobacter sp. DKR-5]MBT1003639.1 DUF3618 domain-containing protein [Paenarthrobacter sp. DKR-5]